MKPLAPDQKEITDDTPKGERITGPCIAVGVAGWSYPDWDGYVYSRGEKDKLGFLARYVDMIEVNSTFYRPPSARISESWAQKTSAFPDFYFSAKLHQKMTHQGEWRTEMVQAFREGLSPLVEADRLRFLLAQFRYDFCDTPASRECLKRMAEAFGSWCDLVVEVRHRSWQTDPALVFLKGLGVELAHLDYPTAANSFDLPVCPWGRNGYLRLHGRNQSAWFDKQAGRDETYNYYYSALELEALKERVLNISKERKSMTVVANNHYHGKEVANALQLKNLLTGDKVNVPPLLKQCYPELAQIAQDGEQEEQADLLF